MTLHTGEAVRTVDTQFLIGADGSRSAIAVALGLDVNTREIVGAETVHRGVPLEGPPHFRCVLDPHVAPGYLAWVVHDGEEVHVGVGGQVRRYAVAQALREFTQGMRVHYDLDHGRDHRASWRADPRRWRVARIANERGLLIGDAAGAVSPLTAGGLDPCLRLSQFAVEVALAYLALADPRR